MGERDVEMLRAQVKDLQEVLTMCVGVASIALGDFGLSEMLPRRSPERACSEIRRYCVDALAANPIEENDPKETP